ncbi:MAG: LysR substrate-binding domain-containing protein [Mangrovicoccus sp.]
MKITLRQLHYFQILAEARNFSRAAELAHVSQPALSVQIRELETTMGGQLVERLPRDIQLTPLGRAVLDHAQKILAGVQELEASSRLGKLKAPLNLGIIPTVAPYLLPPFLDVWGAGTLRIREAMTAMLFDELSDGRLDAIVVATAPPSDRFMSLGLFEDRFLLAGPASRLALLSEQTDALRPDILNPDELLLLDEGHCLADQALAFCDLQRSRLRLDFGAVSLSTLVSLVAANYGLTLLPEIAVRAEQRAAPGLSVQRFSAPQPSRMISLVRRSSTISDDWYTSLAESLRSAGQDLVQSWCDTEQKLHSGVAAS